MIPLCALDVIFVHKDVIFVHKKINLILLHKMIKRLKWPPFGFLSRALFPLVLTSFLRILMQLSEGRHVVISYTCTTSTASSSQTENVDLVHLFL